MWQWLRCTGTWISFNYVSKEACIILSSLKDAFTFMCKQELELTLATCFPAAEISVTLRKVKALTQDRRQALDQGVMPQAPAPLGWSSSSLQRLLSWGVCRCQTLHKHEGPPPRGVCSSYRAQQRSSRGRKS